MLSRTIDILQAGIISLDSPERDESTSQPIDAARSATGLHPGVQIYVAHEGNVIADLAVGQAKPGVAMKRDSLTLWMSACKPITAIAIAQLIERRRLSLDDPVADYVPEFAEHDKQAVTLRHILTHTSGLRYVDVGWPQSSWSQIIDTVCQTRLEPNWTLGKRARYDATISWFMLGEVIRRIDGLPLEIYLRDELFEPLGMTDSWIGMPADRLAAYGDRLATMYQTDRRPIVPMKPYDVPEAITHCRPSANGRGPANQLGRFYQMLLNGGEMEGKRLLKPETVALFTAAQRVGIYDETFRHVIDWGLGFLICSKRYNYKALPYSFGPHASDRAFGHNGFQSSIAFADPDCRLVVVIIPNGAPGEPPHDRRLRATLAAVYEDLGLAPSSTS